MAGTDTRGFAYALEPVRQRREWHLDAAFAHLGRVNKRLADKRAALESLRQQCTAQALHASQSWTVRRDPVACSRVLQYLVALQARAVETEREITALSIELRVAREWCASRQQDLELIDTHRAGLLEAYAMINARKSSAHADAEWLSRNGHHLNEENGR